ncbi:60S ribosomal protein L28 [Blastocystis sp. subtype 4]|uniref:60S ribosomal protein L28 n=1 Tax=Blastocystis sp. subtype 4 TaxID=944170 RepID=UPI000711C772|nr:60S ribosomal protein L28 [Blastocystis sp. subtype 4]KNB43117.1 60S ribosomal protein L28 [Blastocystis sp. subtype 4]|eukprot:XP_014526560.1 60S ribosomal protein L28 [Blastocystis sp. subtype 4]
MSSEVVWNVVKKNSAFMKKQKQGSKVTMFSTDKLNVTNYYTPKYMGICQKRAVGVNCEGKHIMLSIKSTKHTVKPCKMVHKAHVKRAASVAKEVSKGSYRPSLEAAAVARYNTLDRALRRSH